MLFIFKVSIEKAPTEKQEVAVDVSLEEAKPKLEGRFLFVLLSCINTCIRVDMSNLFDQEFKKG